MLSGAAALSSLDTETEITDRVIFDFRGGQRIAIYTRYPCIYLDNSLPARNGSSRKPNLASKYKALDSVDYHGCTNVYRWVLLGPI